jgi:N-acetyl-gamma-glutamylphosphate reductase
VFNRGQKHFSIKDSEDKTRIEPESMNGTNDIEIHVFATLARRQALLIAKFDTLGKGASDVAVQNLMLMPERWQPPYQRGALSLWNSGHAHAFVQVLR